MIISLSIDPVGDAAKNQIDQRMSDREHVARRQRVRTTGAPFDRRNRHFLVRKPLVQQQADNVSLEAENRGCLDASA